MKESSGLSGLKVFKWRRYCWRFAVFVACFALLLFIASQILIPRIISGSVFPVLAERFGFSSHSIECRSIGLGHVDFAGVRLGRAGSPTLRVDSIRIDYNFIDLLFRRHVRRVLLSGVELRAELLGGQLIIPELDLGTMRNSQNSDPVVSASGSSGGFSFGTCEIRSTTLVLVRDGREYRIGGEGALHMTGEKTYRFEGELIPRGCRLFVKGHIRSDTGVPMLELEVPDLDLARFTDLQDLFPGLVLKGNLRLQLACEVSRGIFRLSGDLRNYSLAVGGLEFQGLRGDDASSALPLSFRAESLDGKHLHWHFSGVRMTRPLELDLLMPRGDGRLVFASDQSSFSLPLRYVIDAGLPGLPRRIIGDPLVLDTTLKGKLDRAGNWDILGLGSFPESELKFDFGNGVGGLVELSSLQLRGRGSGTNGDFRIGGKMRLLKVRAGDSLELFCPEIESFADLRLRSGKTPELSGSAKFAGASLGAGRLMAEGISLTLPFRWPLPESRLRELGGRRDGVGMLVVEKLKYDQRALGKLSAELYQDGLGYMFLGRHRELFPVGEIEFSGIGGLGKQGFDAECDFELTGIPESGISVSLADYLAGLKQTSLSGHPGLKGRLHWRKGRLGGNVGAWLSGAELEMPEKKLFIRGINGKLDIPDLSFPRSSPDQSLEFKEVRVGKLLFSDGDLRFQLEDAKTFFLERLSFVWSGGHLYSHALRFNVEQKELDMILFCDRLNLGELLRQLQIADASGEGTVSGRIPISFKGGILDLNDGFLYSSPGQGGVLSLSDAGVFADGAGQSLQLAIAREALRDFRYDWVSMTINRRGDDLVLKMEMDGAPGGKLPFGFTPGEGLFKAPEDSSWSARFQGIRFKFNFILPLDRLMEYGREVGDVFSRNADE